MLILQAILISFIGLLFLLVNDVNSLFLILTSIAVILYCIMYVVLFAAAIKLRYKKPNVARAFKIPGGKVGIWMVIRNLGNALIFKLLALNKISCKLKINRFKIPNYA